MNPDRSNADAAADVAETALPGDAVMPVGAPAVAEASALAEPQAIPAPDPTPTDATRPRRRRLAIALGLARILKMAFTIALFVVGIGLGVGVFQRNQPAPVSAGDTATAGIPTPSVVQELAVALGSNDADSLRSAVPAQPYRLLAGEIQSWKLQEVDKVEILATMADGPRTATEIVIVGRSPAGASVVFNIVVHEQDGAITDFR